MRRLRDPAQQQRLISEWKHPVGTAVIVRRDDDTEHPAVTRSDPWMLCGTAVILLAGISGGYALERVRVAGQHPARASAG